MSTAIYSLSGYKLLEIEAENLRYANLRDADLRYANLRDANLTGANLRGADLGGANLRGADLGGANLRDANLRDANLGRANLRDADLGDANLGRANLRDADLGGANLGRANLGAYSLTPDGAFTAYKRVADCILELLIPADARRTSSLVGRKCRAERAMVVSITADDGTPVSSVVGGYAGDTYTAGEMYTPNGYDDDIRIECTHGVHFFITRQEAEEYR